ncbi:helix-turn-helix domain-containing protein [Micromonospora violae]|uniref:helix-turn-helix domain-containing protein n=1 Tax=Micromonospora violae TaxID=1278207 RepID=UPI0033E4AD91
MVADARRLLGAELAGARKAAGVTQVGLAAKVRWSRSTVANVETARQSAPREFWLACDVALGAGERLAKAWAGTEELSRRLRDQTVLNPVRQGLPSSPPMCVCRDLARLLDLAGASLSLGTSPAAVVPGDGSGRG